MDAGSNVIDEYGSINFFRSVATKSCSKVPMRVAKKMPYKKCKLVPSVDCGIVLKKVPDLICYPEVVEDCKNEVEEVPFIDKERKCELLIFEDCIPVYSINQFRSVYRYIVLLD